MKRSIPIGGFGKRWQVRVANRLHRVWGYCDFNRHEIVLCSTAQQHGVDRGILIHEVLHKLMPFLAEEAVEVAATELDDALEACGY